MWFSRRLDLQNFTTSFSLNKTGKFKDEVGANKTLNTILATQSSKQLTIIINPHLFISMYYIVSNTSF